MYVSNGVLGKLYHAALRHEENADTLLPAAPTSFVYDRDLEVAGFDKFLDTAEEQYKAYAERLGTLMTYSAEREDEILMNNIRNKLVYLRRDNKRYFETKDRIIAAVDALHAEVEVAQGLQGR
jgi:RNA-dependent RNA polymerase